MVYRTRRDRSRPPPVSLVSIMAIVGITACSSASGPSGSGSGGALELVEGASGLASPVYLTAPSGDPRLFVVEQPGRVWIVNNGALEPIPFLDIEGRVGSGGERGLLGLAFHPNYAANGFFYVSFTDLAGNTRVERFAVSPDPSAADVSSAKLILGVGQPFSNHNGGLVAFGPDGMLYIGLGDGGSGGDPLAHGQNTETLLGSLLRIDVVAARRPTPDSAADRC